MKVLTGWKIGVEGFREKWHFLNLKGRCVEVLRWRKERQRDELSESLVVREPEYAWE